MNFSKLKIKNFKWKRDLTVLTILAAIIVPVSLLLVNWSDLRIVYSAGSSAVAPLLTKLDATYRANASINRNIEINVLSTGSGNGLESAVNGTKNFGNVSYAPDKKRIVNTKDLKALDGWTNRHLKSFTIGIDGIGIIYKPGNLDFSLNIDENNIMDIYSAISGDKVYTFGELMNPKNPSINLEVIPFARAGGANKSGTTDAFLKDSGLFANKKDNEKQPYYKRILSGDYGPNVESTRESNVETWKQISSDGGTVGSMTYLSAGFIINNIETINKTGFRVATYKNIVPSLDEISNNYKWRRPLNMIFSINDPNQAVKLWTEWIFKNYLESFVIEAIQEIGVVPLNNTQLQTMTVDGNFWVSDFTIQAYDTAPEGYHWGAQI